jgi:prepilin-type N-terminal cleavage/methylation domain-containing protein
VSGERSLSPRAGFTLLELVVSVLVLGVMLAAFLVFYRSQALALSHQENFLNAKQNAQIGLDSLIRELRTAGSRPMQEDFDAATCGVAASTATVCYGFNSVKGFPRLASANGTSLRLLADFRGVNAGDGPDGCPIQEGEDITYSHDASSRRLLRKVGNGTATPVLEGLTATNGFRIRYYGYGTGTPPPYVEFQAGGGNLTADEIARLTHVVVTLTTEARSRIPGLPPTTSMQTSSIQMRNPAC